MIPMIRKKPPHLDDIRKIVDDPEWQKLRQGLVGTWKTNSKASVLTLRKYLGSMKDPMKVRRVHNYLTGSAFRIGIISSPGITKLLNEVRVAWAKIKEKS